MSEDPPMKMSENLPSGSTATNLVEKLPPEAVGEVAVSVAKAVQRAAETRELSKARRQEVQNQINLLQTTTESQLDRMEALSDVLGNHIDLLSESQRSRIVDTLCELALGGEASR